MTLVALFAFTLQSYITQTHMHDAPAVTHVLAHGGKNVVGITKPDDGKLPPLNDPDNCPLCQEMLLVGHFVSAAVVPILPPVLRVSIVVAETGSSIAIDPVSHSWQGRGPPQA